MLLIEHSSKESFNKSNPTTNDNILISLTMRHDSNKVNTSLIEFKSLEIK